MGELFGAKLLQVGHSSGARQEADGMKRGGL